MEGFLQNSREMAHIVGRQNVGSMHVKRSDLKKTRTLLFPEIRGTLNRCTRKRPLQDSAIIFFTLWQGNLHCTAQVTEFPANFSNPQDGKSTDFSAGKCHLLYFVVVPESLTDELEGHSGASIQNYHADPSYCRT